MFHEGFVLGPHCFTCNIQVHFGSFTCILRFPGERAHLLQRAQKLTNVWRGGEGRGGEGASSHMSHVHVGRVCLEFQHLKCPGGTGRCVFLMRNWKFDAKTRAGRGGGCGGGGWERRRESHLDSLEKSHPLAENTPSHLLHT